MGGGYSFGEALTGLDMATPGAGGRPLSIPVIGEEAGMSVYSTPDEPSTAGHWTHLVDDRAQSRVRRADSIHSIAIAPPPSDYRRR